LFGPTTKDAAKIAALQMGTAVLLTTVAFFTVRPEGEVWVHGAGFFGVALAMVLGGVFGSFFVVMPVVSLVHSLARVAQRKPVNWQSAVWGALLLAFMGGTIALVMSVDVSRAGVQSDTAIMLRLAILVTGIEDPDGAYIADVPLFWASRVLAVIVVLVIVHMVRKGIGFELQSSAIPKAPQAPAE
jgi:hypothetical protein